MRRRWRLSFKIYAPDGETYKAAKRAKILADMALESLRRSLGFRPHLPMPEPVDASEFRRNSRLPYPEANYVVNIIT
jgi:hypothetical protein